MPHNVTVLLAIGALLGAAFPSSRGLAQTPRIADDTKLPQFETASVKANKSATGSTVAIQGSSVRLIGVTARQIVIRAYGVESYDIVAAPEWLAADRFDVVARTPGTPATMPQVNAMLRALLADRFHLAAHVDRREREVYFLVTVRDDGTLGPSIKESRDDDCGGGPTLGAQQRSAAGRCRLLVAAGAIEATGQPVQALASTLGSIVGRPVIDMSGVSGRYDFKLTFAPERGSAGPDAPAADAPSIFTAVREQLGLKLDVHRGPADVLVIERIDRPDPD